MTAMLLPAVSTGSVGQCDGLHPATAEVLEARERRSASLRELAGGHDQIACGYRLAATRGDAVSVRCPAPTVHR